MIEIHLYGKLREYSDYKSPVQESVICFEVIEEDTIQTIIHRLGIPSNEMSSCIFLNGEYSGLTRRVKNGDRLGLFPDNMLLLYRQHFKKVEEK
jgi:hypothetical protein